MLAVTIPTTIFGVPVKPKDDDEIPEIAEYCDVNSFNTPTEVNETTSTISFRDAPVERTIVLPSIAMYSDKFILTPFRYTSTTLGAYVQEKLVCPSVAVKLFTVLWDPVITIVEIPLDVAIVEIPTPLKLIAVIEVPTNVPWLRICIDPLPPPADIPVRLLPSPKYCVAVTIPTFIEVAVTEVAVTEVAVTIPATIFGVPVKPKDDDEIPEIAEYCAVDCTTDPTEVNETTSTISFRDAPTERVIVVPSMAVYSTELILDPFRYTSTALGAYVQENTVCPSVAVKLFTVL